MSNLTRATILLVEPENDLREITCSFLRRKGYDVVGAANIEEALERAELVDSVDLLITDALLPSTTGPKLLARMRGSGFNPKVMYFSGRSPEEICESGVDVDSRSFLGKPCSTRDLLDKIQDILSGKR